MTTTPTIATRPSSPNPSLIRDQLAQFNGSPRTASGIVSGRSVLGWFLTLCGLGVSCWVLFAIHAAIFHPQHVGMPLRNFTADDLTLLLPAGKVQIAPVAVTLIGYALTAVLLAIAGKIALGMLRMGTALVMGLKQEELPKLD